MMSAEYSRSQRLGEHIKRELAKLIHHELKDPRLGMITVNYVELSKDLSFADINVTIFFPNGDDGNIAETMLLLNRAAAFLRTKLGRAVSVRKIPQLRFHYDDSLERGACVNALIHKACRPDRGA